MEEMSVGWMRTFTSSAHMALPVFCFPQSHASLHAWPEYGYCAIDLFTYATGKDMTPLICDISKSRPSKRFFSFMDAHNKLHNDIFNATPVEV
jgi:hypothetical protein